MHGMAERPTFSPRKKKVYLRARGFSHDFCGLLFANRKFKFSDSRATTLLRFDLHPIIISPSAKQFTAEIFSSSSLSTGKKFINILHEFVISLAIVVIRFDSSHALVTSSLCLAGELFFASRRLPTSSSSSENSSSQHSAE